MIIDKAVNIIGTQLCIDRLFMYFESPRIRHARVLELLTQEGWGFRAQDLSYAHQQLFQQIKKNYLDGVAP